VAGVGNHVSEQDEVGGDDFRVASHETTNAPFVCTRGDIPYFRDEMR
jgi:hypothetical protein